MCVGYCSGAVGGIQTRDPRITSAVLYQLSYTGSNGGVFSVHSLLGPVSSVYLKFSLSYLCPVSPHLLAAN